MSVAIITGASSGLGRAFARRLRETGVEHVITGHCTGQEGFDILKDELGELVWQTEVGLILEL